MPPPPSNVKPMVMKADTKNSVGKTWILDFYIRHLQHLDLAFAEIIFDQTCLNSKKLSISTSFASHFQFSIQFLFTTYFKCRILFTSDSLLYIIFIGPLTIEKSIINDAYGHIFFQNLHFKSLMLWLTASDAGAVPSR